MAIAGQYHGRVVVTRCVREILSAGEPKREAASIFVAFRVACDLVGISGKLWPMPSQQKQRNHEEPDYDLARQVARLWPHRKHESVALTSFLCMLGIHYWRALSLGQLYPGKTIHHCFWCSKVRIDGVVYDV